MCKTDKEVQDYFNDNPDKIECLICHRFFQNLGRHIIKHEISTEDYHHMFNIPFKYTLISNNLREHKSKVQKVIFSSINKDEFVNKGRSYLTYGKRRLVELDVDRLLKQVESIGELGRVAIREEVQKICVKCGSEFKIKITHKQKTDLCKRCRVKRDIAIRKVKYISRAHPERKIFCLDCKCEFSQGYSSQKRCIDCQKKYRRVRNLKNRKSRAKK